MKIHKTELAARLITSGTRWITNTISILLAATLQPCLDLAETIAKDTRAVVNSIDKFNNDSSHHNIRVASFDVEQLYPSINQERAIVGIRTVLTEHYLAHPIHCWGLIVEVMCVFMRIIFEAQIVSVRFRGDALKRFFRQTVGVTTGLSCAVQLANSFLLALDLIVVRTFRDNIHMFHRFVDDVLIVFSGIDLVDLLDVFNNWDPLIKVTFDSTETLDKTTFLDLALSIKAGKLRYCTFRKPLNSYCYLPALSCHSHSTKLATVSTECVRLLLTNDSEESFLWHRTFFLRKFVARGYLRSDVSAIFDKYPWHDKDIILGRRACKVGKVVPFKVRFSPGIHALCIGRLLQKHMLNLDASVRAKLKFVVCYSVGSNLFRLRYTRFL